jgi:hypothetical protein
VWERKPNQVSFTFMKLSDEKAESIHSFLPSFIALKQTICPTCCSENVSMFSVVGPFPFPCWQVRKRRYVEHVHIFIFYNTAVTSIAIIKYLLSDTKALVLRCVTMGVYNSKTMPTMRGDNCRHVHPCF